MAWQMVLVSRASPIILRVQPVVAEIEQLLAAIVGCVGASVVPSEACNFWRIPPQGHNVGIFRRVDLICSMTDDGLTKRGELILRHGDEIEPATGSPIG